MELLVATPCLEATRTTREDPGKERGQHGAGTRPLGVSEAPSLSILLPASLPLWPHTPLLNRTEVSKRSLLLLLSLREQRGRGCPPHAAMAHLPHPPHPPHPPARAPASATLLGDLVASALSVCLSPKAPASPPLLHLFVLVSLSGPPRPHPSQPRACKAIPSRQPAGQAPTLGEPMGPALR